MSKKTPTRLHSPDALRGIAALAVAWNHLAVSNDVFFPSSSFHDTGDAIGWAGVAAFFVISGFVIPYSLHRAKYRIRDYGLFLLKRLIRLHPPYIASIIIALGLSYAALLIPGYQGTPIPVSVRLILVHLGYLNAFLGYHWIIGVFWTLAIEMQYYLLVGLSFPLISSPSRFVRYATLIAWGLSGAGFTNAQFLPHWLWLFVMGVLAFHYHAEIIQKSEFMISLVVAVATACFAIGLSTAAIGLLAVVIILFLDLKNRILTFFGAISYSLYLLHAPIEQKVINLSMHFAPTFLNRFSAVLLATGLSILGAFLLYRCVEEPARRWSSAIRYREEEQYESTT